MPDRIIRMGILTSEAVNTLTWPAETFYRRLMSVVDDYGRYDGRIAILRAALYPLKLETVSSSDIGKWIRECVEAALVRFYCVESRDYLELSKFRQRIQGKSKWPEPVENEPPRKSTVNHRESPPYSDADSSTKSNTDTKSVAGSAYSEDFEEFWGSYPRKTAKKDAWGAWSRAKGKPDIETILTALDHQKRSDQWKKDAGQFIPHPGTWLNQARWDDELPLSRSKPDPGDTPCV